MLAAFPLLLSFDMTQSPIIDRSSLLTLNGDGTLSFMFTIYTQQ